MATTTTNYGYNISEGTDLVNPLTDIFPNFTAIDGDLKGVSDEAITTATELKTGTVHALTRSDADREAIRFTATSNYTAGETFTVDGTQVTALTTSGEALTTGAYIIGSEVFCILKGTLLTMYVSQNITDADTLDGHDSTYFATDSDMVQAQNDISDLSTKVGTAVLTTTAQDCSGAINELKADLSDFGDLEVITENQSGSYTISSSDLNSYREILTVLVLGGANHSPETVPVAYIKRNTSSPIYTSFWGSDYCSLVYQANGTCVASVSTATFQYNLYGIK